MNCPHCNQRIPDTVLARHLAAKGGAKATGAKKARTSEQAARAARIRWSLEYDKRERASYSELNDAESIAIMSRIDLRETWKAVGDRIGGVSAGRARQIFYKAYRKMSRMHQLGKLADGLYFYFDAIQCGKLYGMHGKKK